MQRGGEEEAVFFIFYMLLGFLLALMSLLVVKKIAENADIHPSVALGIGIFAFVVVLAFWIGTLRVIISVRR